MIASDGFWDVFSNARAAKMVKRRNLVAEKMSKKCSDAAKHRRFQFGFAPDDITVVVVDINMPEKKPGCCAALSPRAGPKVKATEVIDRSHHPMILQA